MCDLAALAMLLNMKDGVRIFSHFHLVCFLQLAEHPGPYLPVKKGRKPAAALVCLSLAGPREFPSSTSAQQVC